MPVSLLKEYFPQRNAGSWMYHTVCSMYVESRSKHVEEGCKRWIPACPNQEERWEEMKEDDFHWMEWEKTPMFKTGRIHYCCKFCGRYFEDDELDEHEYECVSGTTASRWKMVLDCAPDGYCYCSVCGIERERGLRCGFPCA